MADDRVLPASGEDPKRETSSEIGTPVPPAMRAILATVATARAASSDCDRCRDLVQGRVFVPRPYPNKRCEGADKLIAFGAHRYVAELAFDLGEHERLGHHLADEVALLQAHANCLHRDTQQAAQPASQPAPPGSGELSSEPDADAADLGVSRDDEEWRQLVRRARFDRERALGRVDELVDKLAAAEHERDLLAGGASTERGAVDRARIARERAQKNAEGHKREKIALQAEIELLRQRERDTLADVERLRLLAEAKTNGALLLDPWPLRLFARLLTFLCSRYAPRHLVIEETGGQLGQGERSLAR